MNEDSSADWCPTVRVLGPVSLGDAGPITREQDCRVLGRLSLHRGEPVAMAELVDAVWEQGRPAVPERSIRNAVLRLRKQLAAVGADGLIETAADGYLLSSRANVDLWELRSLRGLSAAQGDDLNRQMAVVRLISGRAFTGTGSHPFWVAERRNVDGEVASAAGRLLEVSIDSGRVVEALGVADRIGERDPENERLAGLRMVAWVVAGEPDRACLVYDDLTRCLGERGLAPSPSLVSMRELLVGGGAVQGPSGLLSILRGEPTAGGVVPDHGESPQHLVGSERELSVLRESWRSAADAGCVVEVRGVSGMGKTSVVASFAAEVEADSALVLWGTARRGGGSGYEPVTEAMGAAFTVESSARLAENLAMFGDELTQLVGVADWPIEVRPGSSGPPAARTERGLYAAVSSLIEGLAADRQVLMVLDDVQWLSSDSRRMMQYLVDRCVAARVMFVMIRSDTSGVASPSDSTSHQISVGPLDLNGARNLLGPAAGSLTAESLDQVLELAAGNPRALTRFADEIGRGGDEGQFPVDTVSALVDDYLVRVESSAVAVMNAASVAGPCPVARLRLVVHHLPPSDFDTQLAHLEKVGVLHVASDGKVRFVHRLVGIAVAARAEVSERALWHDRLARTLAEERTPDLVAVATHRIGAATAGLALEQLATWVGRAVEVLMSTENHQECVALVELAGPLVPLEGQRSRQWWELQLVYGEALQAVGRHEFARQVLWGAIDGALLAGQVDLAARATLSLSWAAWMPSDPDRDAIREALEASCCALGAASHELRGRLTLRLALFEDDSTLRASFSDEGLAEAGRAQDQAVMARALSDWLLVEDPSRDLRGYDERAREVLELGGILDDRSLIVSGLVHHNSALLAREGDLDQFARVLCELRDRYGDPSADVGVSLLALLRGDIDAVMDRAAAIFERGRGRLDPGALIGLEGQLVSAYRMSGDRQPLIELRDRYELSSVMWDIATVGEADDASVALVKSLVTRVDGLLDEDPPASSVVLARLSGAVAERQMAAEAKVLFDRLEPRAGLYAAARMYDFEGAVDHHLGCLALVLGDFERACRLLVSGREAHRRVRSAPWLGLSQIALADLDLSRPGGDVEAARLALDAATALLSAPGLCQLLEGVEAQRKRLAEHTCGDRAMT